MFAVDSLRLIFVFFCFNVIVAFRMIKHVKSSCRSSLRVYSIPDTNKQDSFRYIQGYDRSFGISTISNTNNDPLHTRSTFIVGIAGGSGSGKTTLTKAIVDSLGSEFVSFISHDSYYKDLRHMTIEERAKVNFDHPNALDTSLLETHLKLLKKGQSVNVPVYDFKTHARTNSFIEIQPKPIVIVDGILIFSEPNLIDEMDMKIFVDTESDVRLLRRIRRDVTERQRSVESVMDQYEKYVKPMHELYVETSKRKADIIVPATSGIQAVALDMCVSRMREIINFYQ